VFGSADPLAPPDPSLLKGKIKNLLLLLLRIILITIKTTTTTIIIDLKKKIITIEEK
jgi:hypothetical protein